MGRRWGHTWDTGWRGGTRSPEQSRGLGGELAPEKGDRKGVMKTAGICVEAWLGEEIAASSPALALTSCSLPDPVAHIKVGTPSPCSLPEWVQVITSGSLKLLMDRR